MLDRLDLHVEAPSLTFDQISSHAPGESSAAVRERVRAVDRFGISGRAHDRTLRVALTLRDLDDLAHGRAANKWPVELGDAHVGEALAYRQQEASIPLHVAAEPEAWAGEAR